jgi:hypothetical protein
MCGLVEETLWLFQVVSSALYALGWIAVPARGTGIAVRGR